MTKYAAFLRGINSGRNPGIKMEVLREAFEDLGLQNVKTVLASGNVLFETDAGETTLEQNIEKALPGAIGFESGVIVRTIDSLRKLVRLNPFKNVEVTPQTRLYVTFVKRKLKPTLQLPVTGKGYTILGIFDDAVCSVVDLSSAKTPDLMQALDKKFGKANTTRNWNTLEKIIENTLTI